MLLKWNGICSRGHPQSRHVPTLLSHRKISHRRLAHMLSLSRPDPGLPSTAPGAVGKLEWGDASLAASLAKASCGSQLDLIEVQEAEGMHMELEEDEPPSDPLTFEEDEENVFVSTAKAEQPPAATVSSAVEESGALPTPASSSGMLNMCKCAAAQLDIPWHIAVAEAPRSCYEGKKLPLARNAL